MIDLFHKIGYNKTAQCAAVPLENACAKCAGINKLGVDLQTLQKGALNAKADAF